MNRKTELKDQSEQGIEIRCTNDLLNIPITPLPLTEQKATIADKTDKLGNERWVLE